MLESRAVLKPRADPAQVPPQPQADAEPWPFVKFRVPPAWMHELDVLAGERAISRADLSRMIFREFLKDRLAAATA